MGTYNSNSKSTGGRQVKSFSKMSEDQRVNAIANALNNKSPDDMLEDVIYRLSDNEKPLTASDDDILATGSEIIYKTFTPRYDKKEGKRLTADELAKKLYNGENVERPGRNRYGVGNYFMADYSTDDTKYILNHKALTLSKNLIVTNGE